MHSWIEISPANTALFRYYYVLDRQILAMYEQ